MLNYALSLVRICRTQPGCEGRIRSAAAALAFCLMNDLDLIAELGYTTGGTAAQICENPRAALLRYACTCTYLTLAAGLVVQAAVCSAATKAALTLASRRNTSKPCEQTHRVQYYTEQLL